MIAVTVGNTGISEKREKERKERKKRGMEEGRRKVGGEREYNVKHTIYK